MSCTKALLLLHEHGLLKLWMCGRGVHMSRMQCCQSCAPERVADGQEQMYIHIYICEIVHWLSRNTGAEGMVQRLSRLASDRLCAGAPQLGGDMLLLRPGCNLLNTHTARPAPRCMVVAAAGPA